MLTRRKFLAALAALSGANGRAVYAAPEPAAADQEITHAKIHPAIGIARVGNSREDFFIGPEVPEGGTLPVGGYKDRTGALKRQVARFRVYGCNAAGAVVRELTPDDAAITWTVWLANKKAEWYQFQLALDLPEATLPGAAVSWRRNPQIRGPARRQLVIDPGPRSIEGRSTSGAAYQLDGGKFFNLAVPLGELRTDENGRLLVFGGAGLSRSVTGLAPTVIANNDGWHDDVSDGPVEARVRLHGREIPVEGAWVVVAPPDYVPGLKTVRTLHDLMFDCAVAWGFAPAPTQVSFVRHIAPIFRRMSDLQWVNQGFAATFGFGATYEAERIIARLADASPTNQPYRQGIFEKFRNPREHRLGKTLWPPFYGDAWDYLDQQEPDVTVRHERSMAPVSDLQLDWLEKWASGDFISDLATGRPAPETLAELPVAGQPAALDEAALSHCLADAFHPGCEVTWPIRHRSLFRGPLRFRRRPADVPEPDYGLVLTPAVALGDQGPLSGLAPGDLTRWMAVPWQTDTGTCRSAFRMFHTSESLPTFWPAHVPNQVLSEADYQVALDPGQPLTRRQEAFATRRDWFRGLGNDPNNMVTEFHQLGVIEARPGPADGVPLPARMFVESKPDLPLPENQPDPAATSSGPGGDRHEAGRLNPDPAGTT
jgi:hypothetical protein